MKFIRSIKSPLKLSKESFYGTYLHIINAFIPIKLTEREIDILIYLYNSGIILTKEVRKEIRERIGISEKNLNNFISKLTKKQALVDNEISSKLLPPIKDSFDSEDTVLIQLEFIVDNAPK